MTPGWLGVLAWITIASGFLTAAAILYDMYGRGRRQIMQVMAAVWPITALYLGPLGWALYARLGRAQPAAVPAPREEELAGWRGVFVSGTHCGAGCVAGDVLGEWLVFAAGWSIAGHSLWAEYIVDFALGYIFGIAFQYWAIKPMSILSPGAALRRAVVADTLSIIAFEAGMFGWMAFFQLVLFPGLMPNDPAYWLMMQIAMAIGL